MEGNVTSNQFLEKNQNLGNSKSKSPYSLVPQLVGLPTLLSLCTVIYVIICVCVLTLNIWKNRLYHYNNIQSSKYMSVMLHNIGSDIWVTSSMYTAMVMQVRSAGDKRLQEERRNRQMLEHEIEKYRMYITHQDRYIRDLQRLLTSNSISYHDYCTPPPDIDTWVSRCTKIYGNISSSLAYLFMQ